MENLWSRRSIKIIKGTKYDFMKGNYGNIIIKFVVNGSRKFPLLMQMIMYRCAIEQLACILKRPFGLTWKLGENPGQSVLGGMQHQAGFQSGCPPARPPGRTAGWLASYCSAAYWAIAAQCAGPTAILWKRWEWWWPCSSSTFTFPQISVM